jgi:hypothetical protein
LFWFSSLKPIGNASNVPAHPPGDRELIAAIRLKVAK